MAGEQMKLDAIIRAALKKWSDEPDPHVIAMRLVQSIPEKDVRRCLGICLSDRVRRICGDERRDNFALPADVERQRTEGKPKWEGRLAPGLRWLSGRVCIDGEWKLAGDCTADDLEWLAADREQRAEELKAWAARYREMAAQMRAAGVGRARDLYADEPDGEQDGEQDRDDDNDDLDLAA